MPVDGPHRSRDPQRQRSLIGAMRGGRGDLAQAREGIGELFTRVAAIRHQAEASEAMVQVPPLNRAVPPGRFMSARLTRGHSPERPRPPTAEQAEP